MDINKFSFGQLTSNQDGKTSGSGTAGILICFIGAICFFYGCIRNNTVIMTSALTMTTIGAGLLGYRKAKEADVVSCDTTTEESVDEK